MPQVELLKKNHIPFEPLKRGRYAPFYDPGVIPNLFLSVQAEQSSGSTPFLIANDEFGLPDPIHWNESMITTPQIRLIDKDKLVFYLQWQLGILQSSEIQESLKLNSNLKETLIALARSHLAAVDWAERTYFRQINIPDC